MVRTRILTAAVLAPLLWALVQYGPIWLFAAVLGLAIVQGLREAYAMARARGAEPFSWLGSISGLALAAAIWAPPAVSWGAQVPLVAATLLAFIAAMARREGHASMLAATIETVFPLLYVALAGAHLIALRAIGPDVGRHLLFLLFFCVMFSDTAAYFFGRAFGKRPLAPKLSPKKSWEGAIAGMLASSGGAALAKIWFLPQLAWFDVVVLGLLLGAAGILGDLAESMLKRASNVKDSSNLIPGHGGLLDRVDSLLFSAPVLFYYYDWVAGGVG